VTEDTWRRLDDLFVRWPQLRAGSVSAEEIESVLGGLGIPLPPPYREFVAKHGGAIVGSYSICGTRPAPAMGKSETADALTRRFRAQRWPGAETWLVFSTDHAGNPVGFDDEGVVWSFDHDFGGVHRIADGFEACLRGWCLGQASE
jgi:hypothetical protein